MKLSVTKSLARLEPFKSFAESIWKRGALQRLMTR